MTAHDPELVEQVADLLDDLDGSDLEVIARAVLDAITTSPRHAIVELPKGQAISFGSFGEGRMFPVGPDRRAIYSMPDQGPNESVQTALSDSDEGTYNPAEAREIAAALLAAARAAESTTTEQVTSSAGADAVSPSTRR